MSDWNSTTVSWNDLNTDWNSLAAPTTGPVSTPITGPLRAPSELPNPRRWHLYVIDAAGTRVGELDDYTEATIIPRHNRVGAWSLTTANTPTAQLLNQAGFGIEAAYGSTVVLSGPVANRERTLSADDQGVFDGFVFSGYDDLIWLTDREAHPQPGSTSPPYATQAHDVRAGRASSVIAEYVNVNAGPAAVPARRIPGLTIGPDLGIGTAVTGRARWRFLLDDITGLATAGGIGFRMRSRQFETFLPEDRSSSVKFSVALGNLAGFTYREQRPRVNHVYVGGGGELTARIIVEAEDTASIARWGRIEAFVDRRDTTDPVELAQAAQENLIDGATQHGFSLEPTESLSTVYLEHYNLGDIVAVVVDEVEIRDVVHEVQIRFTAEDGARAIPTIGDPESAPGRLRIYDAIGRLAKNVRNLERR